MNRIITPEQLAAIDLTATDLAVYFPGVMEQTDVNRQPVWLDRGPAQVGPAEEDGQ